ncbi:MAG TPA: M48 family metalloprotease [Candidatus Saccharimonadales bacterium]|nr:M48 family metalloprotease [Candidatus Saccharimonadales bacterium]
MNIYNQISSNKWRTWLIMALFIIFITTLGFVFGKATGYGLSYAGIALIFAGITSIGSYYYSDKIVLATTGATPIKKSDDPELYHIVENLAIGDGLPMPKVYMLRTDSPNAFATGRDPQHAVVCVTTGLRQMMSKSELEGVLAHEMSHVKNLDTRLMGIVAILVGFVAILANMFMNQLWWGGFGGRDDRENGNSQIFLVIGILFAILSPIVATLIQLALSRKREYLADASGVLLTRYPEGLADALEKIAKYKTPIPSVNNATAQLFIENPMTKTKGKESWFAGLFDTHPPIEDRIRILRSM